MSKFKHFIYIVVLVVFTLIIGQTRIQADETLPDAVYFGSQTCLNCQQVESSGVLSEATQAGYQITKYISEQDYDQFESMFTRYARTYNVPRNKNLVPILYVGDRYYNGAEAIIEGFQSGEIQAIMDVQSTLEPIEFVYADITLNDLWVLMGSTAVLGILDAFNPCAIAMLLMFLSFLTERKRSKTVFFICLSYILAIFVTYFILGTFLSKALALLAPYMIVMYAIIIVLALFISVLNFMDFFAARRKAYGDIKNQLPRRIFTFTKKLMNGFSESIDSGDISVYLIAFLIGMFVAIVEFPCSGQAFVAWTAIVVDRTAHVFLFNALLFIYVLLFVSPLIIISVVTVKSQNIHVVSNFVRTRLDIIKLVNALVFLGVAIYYIFRVFI